MGYTVIVQVIDPDCKVSHFAGQGDDPWSALSQAYEQWTLGPQPAGSWRPVARPPNRTNGPPTLLIPPGNGHPSATLASRDRSQDTSFTPEGPKCKQHEIGKPSKKGDGSWYCPKKVDGGFCQWSYP